MKSIVAWLPVLLIVACFPVPAATPAPVSTPLPTVDARATEARIVANAFATLTASAPTPSPSSTPDFKATEAKMYANVMATIAASTPPATATPPATPTPASTSTRAATSTPTVTFTPLPTPTLARNRISGFNAKDLSARAVQVDVDYFYNGEWGTDKVFITANANTNSGRILEIWGQSIPIQPGEGFATIEVGLVEVAQYGSSRIVVCMYAEGTTPRSFCQDFSYTKNWIVKPSPTPKS